MKNKDKKLLCKIGLHKWRPILLISEEKCMFINGDKILFNEVVEKCSRCGMERIVQKYK